jgi:hypothetical protein
MATTWRITPGTDRVQLGAERQADITFTVTNDGPVDDRAVVDMVPGDPAERAWFAVAEPQRLVPRGASVPFLVHMAVPPGVPPGARWVQARVYSADTAPEESSMLSDRVTFDVPGAMPVAAGSGKRWLWLIPVAVLVLAVLGVGAFLALRSGDTPDSQPAAQSTEEQTPPTEPSSEEPSPTEPEATSEPPPPEPPPSPPPIGNLIASPDNPDCFFVSGELQVGFYILLIGATPDDLPGLVDVSASTDYGVSARTRSAVSGNAQTNVTLALPPSERGRNHTVTITVDGAGEVPETDEADNVVRVDVNVPANPPLELSCSGSRG